MSVLCGAVPILMGVGILLKTFRRTSCRVDNDTLVPPGTVGLSPCFSGRIKADSIPCLEIHLNKVRFQNDLEDS